MKQARRCQRILIVSLLAVSVLAPVVFFSAKLGRFSSPLGDKEEFYNDVSGIRYPNDALRLKSIEQEEGDGVKEPERVILEDIERTPELEVGQNVVNMTVTGLENGTAEEKVRPQQMSSNSSDIMVELGHKAGEESKKQTRILADERIKEMKDQIIVAKAYLNLAPPSSNSHLVRELRLRIKEMERTLDHANRDSDLSRSALQKKRAMEVSLAKARKVFPDCSDMATKLRSMAYNTEEQLRAQKKQASYLIELAARTFPKGHHCLSMRLTSEYFTLQSAERELPNKQRANKPHLYHYALLSDNVLACAVVVNSTISTSKKPEKIVFHVITDSLNYPAMVMWFLLNPPGQATIQVENVEDFDWIPSNYMSMVKRVGVKDPRYGSVLNHLRFYMPQIFPYLDKVLFLDHDVVVQRDLSNLWKVDMKGKVNGAVEMCKEGESSHPLATLVDFSNPSVTKQFDPKTCVWAFGMNVFDLQQWRRRGLTSVYNKWFQLSTRRHLIKAGSLPLGQIVFYNHTFSLDWRWHVQGLGYDSDVGRNVIEKAAVIHYSGHMKPWLEIGIPRYRGYWHRFLDYDHPYLQRCNIHE